MNKSQRECDMNKSVPNDGFKPKPTRMESKGDNTTKVAKAIIKGEAAERAAKTERLRQARLAQEAAGTASKPGINRSRRR